MKYIPKVKRLRDLGIAVAVGIMDVMIHDYFAVIASKNYSKASHKAGISGSHNGEGYIFISLNTKEDIDYVRTLIQRNELVEASWCDFGTMFHFPDDPLKDEKVKTRKKSVQELVEEEIRNRRKIARIKREAQKNNGNIL